MSSDWETIDSEDEMEQEGASSGDEVNSEIWWPGKRKRAAPCEVSSLEHIALECIDKDFDIFLKAYSVSEDPAVRKGLEFLRRLYSSHFISNKLENGILDPEYFDFLINEHLKELNFAIFAIGDFDQVLKRLKDVGHGISEASFDPMYARSSMDNQDVQEFISNAVCCLPNVNILNIRFQCTDEILKNISTHCLDLKELYIDNSSITHSGLELLCSNDGHTSALKVLSLNSIDLENISVSFLLKNMPLLEVLHHPELWKMIYAIHKSDLENNSLKTTGKYNLTTLTINALDYARNSATRSVPLPRNLRENNHGVSHKYEDMVCLCLDLCPNVTTLTLNFQEEFDIMLVTRFCKLENLELNSIKAILNLNDFLIKSERKLKRLTISSCDNNDLSLQASVLVQSCPQLEYLKMDKISLQSMDNAAVKPLSKLRELFIKDFNFSQPHIEESVDYILKCSSKLEHLSIVNCKLEDSEMNTKLAKFFENSALEHVTFSGTDVEEALLQTVVLTCLSIKTITVEYCDNITYDQIYNLNKTAGAMPNFIDVIWNDDRSEDNSLSNPFDDYDFEDDFYDNVDDYDNVEDYDNDYDSDGNISDGDYGNI